MSLVKSRAERDMVDTDEALEIVEFIDIAGNVRLWRVRPGVDWERPCGSTS